MRSGRNMCDVGIIMGNYYDFWRGLGGMGTMFELLGGIIAILELLGGIIMLGGGRIRSGWKVWVQRRKMRGDKWGRDGRGVRLELLWWIITIFELLRGIITIFGLLRKWRKIRPNNSVDDVIINNPSNRYRNK